MYEIKRTRDKMEKTGENLREKTGKDERKNGVQDFLILFRSVLRKLRARLSTIVAPTLITGMRQ